MFQVGMSLFTLGLERGLVPLGANAGQRLGPFLEGQLAI